jgi:hypothetical protein
MMKSKILLFCLLLITVRLQAQNTNGFVDVEQMRRALGLSLGASKIYTKENEGFTYAGYAEILYQDYSSTAHWEITNLHPVDETLPLNKNAEFGLTRGVLFLGYRYNDHIVFNSEFRADRDIVERGIATFPDHYETSHVSTEGSVDLAYVDYRKSTALTFRGGIILVPTGLINEFHNPQEYLGTRPGFGDIFTYPSIWHALGFGIAGRKGPFDYRAYVVSGFNAAGFTEFGWRGGREVSWDTISHPAFTFRIDYNPIPNGTLGGSYYLGNSGVFGLDQNVSQTFRTEMLDLHGEFRLKGAVARAQYAKGLLGKSWDLNEILQKQGLRAIGGRVVGGYVEGGYNILWYKENGMMIMPYMRGEASNSQDSLPPPSIRLGGIKNHFVDFIIWVFGVEVRPIRGASIKLEYINQHDQNQIFWKEYHFGASYSF